MSEDCKFGRNQTGGAGKPASPPSPYLEPSPYAADRGEIIGVSPLNLSRKDILALGHPTTPMQAIRANCLDCCNGSPAEIRKCTAIGCAMWPLRMGKNVYHASAKLNAGGSSDG
jgi:hypothetical protein